MKTDDKQPYWWKGNKAYILDGYIRVLEIASTPNDGIEIMNTVCLGREEDIIPILEGKNEMPDGLHPRVRRIITEMIEEEENDGEQEPGGRGVERAGNARPPGNKDKDARRVTAEQKLSHRKAHTKK